MSSTQKQLLKRIAELVGLNRALRLENDQLHDQNEALQQELEEKKKIIARVLPDESDYEEEGKNKRVNVRKIKMGTVLFAEAQGFSDISEEMDSEALVDHLDDIYFQLENIISKYEISKVKSLGDTFLCAGGIVNKNTVNPLEVVRAAIEAQYYIRELQKSFENTKIWQFKMGIHTGPITTYEEGRRKKYYELKGDTVNIATRVRSFARPGEIMITENTYELVKDLFNCQYYGKMPVKYKETIKIFKVNGIEPEYSLRKRGIIPNKHFINKYRQVQFTDLQEFMLDKLERELPQNLYYHSVKHTVDVVTQVELIGWGEGITEDEIVLLKTAALFHDAGHIIDYDNHEYQGTLLARELLPAYYYTQHQIERICELIMITKMPPNPNNLLEEIMCDSDLDYLGRSDMIPVSGELFKELRERDKISSLNDWNKLQIKFISNHQYFTKTAKSLREVNKKKQIERIKKLIVN
ncbi:MAG: HD domain-containing protein [Bacteroidetes bacterium]|jgi:class 3 adenylate cyclase|nr:HD domain-containing protein [Bacteroidota bacterium]